MKEKRESDPCIYDQLIFYKGTEANQWVEKKDFWTNNARVEDKYKIYEKKKKKTPDTLCFTHNARSKLGWITDQHIKVE